MTETITEKQNEKGLPVIEIAHLGKSFGKNHVITDFNLTVEKGENIVVLGKSGCGKSVLIKCIVGLIPYHKGSIKVFGNEISKMEHHELDALRARIGFVFQSSALYDSLTIKENLAFALRRHGRHKPKAEIQSLVEETLDNVGLLHVINQMPSELSGGMKKRVGLARALVLHPEIILYDEPTTGLDPITAEEISNLMLSMQKKYNTSSIIISHDMHCSKITANRMVVMINGINFTQGTYEQLKENSDPKVQAFFK